MGAIRGQREYEKWKGGKTLTRKQSQLAHCFECNGFEEGRADCKGYSCPMYLFYPYHNKKAIYSVEKGKYVVSNAKKADDAKSDLEIGGFVDNSQIVETAVNPEQEVGNGHMD